MKSNKESTSAGDNVNDKMVLVNLPLETDILLGQGHYRHPGNQRLNQIVDAKVFEYKTATRPFKTFMSHEIIQKLRKKDGVRFLKELAPKGWVVVNDDKEAKEKISQRFQYAMRKMAENPPVSVDATTNDPQPTEPVPAPQPNLIWKGTTIKVPFLPVFHQLQKSSVMVDDDINAVSKRLQGCFDIVGVQEFFNYEEANAKLSIAGSLTLQMNLWKPLGAKGVIVELINLVGDIMTFQKYSRYILEAATGLFDSYKHTLCQSRRLTTASVHDHVTIFSFNQHQQLNPKPPAVPLKDNEQHENTKEPKRGGIPVLYDRSLHDGTKEPAKRDRPTFLSSGGDERSRDTEGWVPTTDHDCLGQEEKKQPNSSKRNSLPSFSDKPLTDTGIKTKQQPNTSKSWQRTKHSNLARPSPKRPEANVSFPPNYHNFLGMSTSDSMIGRFDEARAAFSRWEVGSKKSIKVASPSAGNPDAVRRTSLPGKLVTNKCIDGNADMRQLQTFTKWNEAQHIELNGETTGRKNKIKFNDTSNRTALSNRGGIHGVGGVHGVEGPYRSNHRLAGSTTIDDEMKCDSSVDEDPTYHTTACMESTTDTISRLSLTNENAENDVRTGTNVPDLPAQWTENQEMKCDSSFDDDDPWTDNPLSQSFIPSAFFGAGPLSSQHATPKMISPPSPAGSHQSSHFSVEMRSLPSPSLSLNSHLSVEVYSLPSPSNSSNSKCSLTRNSFNSMRMDCSLSPSMFHSDQSEEGSRTLQPGALLHGDSDDHELSPVPPTIFVDSSPVGPAS